MTDLPIWIATVYAWLLMFAGQPLPDALSPEADPRYGGQPVPVVRELPRSACPEVPYAP